MVQICGRNSFTKIKMCKYAAILHNRKPVFNDAVQKEKPDS